MDSYGFIRLCLELPNKCFLGSAGLRRAFINCFWQNVFGEGTA